MPKPAPLLAAVLSAAALAACGMEAQPGGPETPANDGSSEALQALLEEAREAAQDGDLADAGALLDQARALEPENPDVWVEISRLRFRGGEHQQALDAADQAVELGPDHAPALLLRAQMVRDAYGLTSSLVWFEAAVEADPDDPLALAEYAATLGDAGYYAEMLGVTRALADIAPKDPRVFFLKAVLAARAGKPVLAKSLVERSGLAREGVHSALMLDALIDLQQRNFDTASETLERLVEVQPGNTRARELLARAMWLGNRDLELIDRFADDARADEASPYLAMLVGRALERQGNRLAAAPFLEKAYAGRSDGWAALSDLEGLPEPTNRMRRLVEQERWPQTRRFSAQLTRQFPGSSDIAALSGDAALASGNSQSALEYYRRAARIRRPWPLTVKVAAAYRDFGDPLAADVLLARHLVSEPRNTEALLLAAERAARLEDWLRVSVLLDNAITLGAGNDPRLLKLRATAARALGRDEEARRFERMTWELHPGILPQG
ncbi:MAG: tetratricopeptide repeat protein [Pseudomonadota bacterium]